MSDAVAIGDSRPFGAKRVGVAPVSLVLTLLGALLLRLYGIASFSWEQDELYTVIESRALYHSPLQPGIHARPLYYLFEHAAFWLFPPTPLSLRIPPLVFGLAALWVTWLLAERIMGRVAAVTAVSTMALSPWHLYVSTFGRYYSLVCLLSVGFLYFAWSAIESRRPRDYVGALVCALVGSATHPSFLIGLAGPAAVLALVQVAPRYGVRWPEGSAMRWLWIPWAVFLAAAALALRLTGASHQVSNFSGRGITANLRLVPAMVQWMTPVIFTTFVIGAVVAMRSEAGGVRRWGLMALASAIVTPMALFLVAFKTNVYPDYGIAMLPVAHISTGVLVATLAEAIPRQAKLAATAMVLIVAAAMAPSTVSHLLDGTRFDYRPALEEIRHTEARLPVLASPQVVAMQYAPDLQIRLLELKPEALDSALQGSRGFWAVVSEREYGVVGDDGGMPWLWQHCRVRQRHERMRLDGRRYRVDLYRCPA